MDPREPTVPHGWGESSYAMLPFLGNFLFLLVILGSGTDRSLSVAPGQASHWAKLGKRSPEEEAKQHPRRALRPRRHHFR